MKNKFGIQTKLLLLIAAVGLVAVLFTPMWRIELDAPQYPEGLSLTIHANGLKGNVDIINGLNHYIGMKTLHNEDFIEFTILPYIIVFFAVAFALVALLGNRRWLNALFISFVLFGVIAMVDFWRWEYNYGHDLNPNAAIVVPGMAYQPPLIGFKQLLNFGAYSIPDTGGWIFIIAGALLLACVVMEWQRPKAATKKLSRVNVAVGLLLLCFLNSCTTGHEAIFTGKDNCYFCKMTITDAKYGGEILTNKGRIYKFDDIHCLLAFSKANVLEPGQVKDIYLVDYSGNHELVKATESYLVQGGTIHGPMNGNAIAVKDKGTAQTTATAVNGTVINWEQLIK